MPSRSTVSACFHVIENLDLACNNVLGKRDGQESEPVTTNRDPQSRLPSAFIGSDWLAFLTVSLAKYVTLYARATLRGTATARQDSIPLLSAD
jgi:hypothetical protein